MYQTKNLEDLFEQFPNGFTIYQSHTEGEYRIKVELTGDPETKMIAGTIKKVNRKNREITSQVEVKYQFFELDESEVLDISFYGSNSNAGYYYTVSVENKAGLEFNERVYD